eukprot:jgi/Chrzof1/15/Cz01g00160.t1
MRKTCLHLRTSVNPVAYRVWRPLCLHFCSVTRACFHFPLTTRIHSHRQCRLAVHVDSIKQFSHAVKRRSKMASTSGLEQRKLTIAVEGCCHGELDTLYSTLQHLDKVEGRKVDLLICCGDFQAVRNQDDLETMAVPDKYKHMMTFYKYYSGEKQAPYPTLFIGGNHEAPNYLWELYYGGWAAPRIFFLGYAGVVKFGGYRIGGLSGIYSQPHYRMGHFERPPYDHSALRSAYHVRELEVYRLMQLQQHVDMFVSHDWPQHITKHGDHHRLFKKKPCFKKEAERGELGSPANHQLLTTLRPSYWFAAHLHVKFPAVVQHNLISHERRTPSAAQAAVPGITSSSSPSGVTKFLALDKPLPGRDFLQIIELDVKGPLEFQYDEEWLAVLRSTHSVMSLERKAKMLPPNWGNRRGKG